MIEKYIIYAQVKSGIVKQVAVLSSHKEKARADYLKTNPGAKITNIQLL